MNKLLPPTLAAAVIALASLSGGIAKAERAVAIPAAAQDVPPASTMQTAVLAGGCYWGMEAVFEHIKGVKSVTSGYAGGTAASANYQQVSAETTQHAEAVKIVYDPAKVSYATLLRVYFSIAHNPTQFNRQGPDTGSSYRSAIFPQNAAQRTVAAAYIAQLKAAKVYPKPIVTQLERGGFYAAEPFMQHFYDKNPMHPYIVAWDKPKVAAFKAAFPDLYT